MRVFKIIFRDVDGNELYTKEDEFFDYIDAVSYADKVVANGRHNEDHFHVYEV
jgi:hypothetical protein